MVTSEFKPSGDGLVESLRKPFSGEKLVENRVSELVRENALDAVFPNLSADAATATPPSTLAEVRFELKNQNRLRFASDMAHHRRCHCCCWLGIFLRRAGLAAIEIMRA